MYLANPSFCLQSISPGLKPFPRFRGRLPTLNRASASKQRAMRHLMERVTAMLCLLPSSADSFICAQAGHMRLRLLKNDLLAPMCYLFSKEQLRCKKRRHEQALWTALMRWEQGHLCVVPNGHKHSR